MKVKKGAPSLTEQIDVLLYQVRCLRRSHREKDGVVRDKRALHEIRCYLETLRWLRELRKESLRRLVGILLAVGVLWMLPVDIESYNPGLPGMVHRVHIYGPYKTERECRKHRDDLEEFWSPANPKFRGMIQTEYRTFGLCTNTKDKGYFP